MVLHSQGVVSINFALNLHKVNFLYLHRFSRHYSKASLFFYLMRWMMTKTNWLQVSLNQNLHNRSQSISPSRSIKTVELPQFESRRTILVFSWVSQKFERLLRIIRDLFEQISLDLQKHDIYWIQRQVSGLLKPFWYHLLTFPIPGSSTGLLWSAWIIVISEDKFRCAPTCLCFTRQCHWWIYQDLEIHVYFFYHSLYLI